MQENDPSYLEEVPPKDWERTPISVKKLVEKMGQRIEILENQQAELLLVQQQLLEKVIEKEFRSQNSGIRIN